MTFHFDVSLEFKEDDGKGNFSTVPKDKNVFKLRKDVEKKLCIVVTQITNNKELKIERSVNFFFQMKNSLIYIYVKQYAFIRY